MSTGPAQPSATRTASRRRAFKLVALLATVGAVELVCRLELERRFRSPALTGAQRQAIERALSGEATYLVPSPELGWEIAPATSRGLYRSNAAGFRSDRDHAAAPAPGVVRAVLVGDSFTHGDEVALGDTWGRALERRLPRLETLNLGVCGYGPDQALLRFRRDGLRWGPRVAVLGIVTEHLNRVANTFRPLYMDDGLAFGKPRFRVVGGDLALAPNPLASPADYRRLLEDPERELARIGREDDFYVESTGARAGWLASVDLARAVAGAGARKEPLVELTGPGFRVYNPRSEPFTLLRGIARAFHAEALAAGAVPLVVLFPMAEELPQLRAGGPPIYAPLAGSLCESGVACVDIAARVPPGAIEILPGGHYAPATQARVADAVLAALRDRAPDLALAAGQPR